MTDADNDLVSVEWTLLSAPDTSFLSYTYENGTVEGNTSAIINYHSERAELRPDVRGTYTVQFVATDGHNRVVLEADIQVVCTVPPLTIEQDNGDIYLKLQTNLTLDDFTISASSTRGADYYWQAVKYSPDLVIPPPPPPAEEILESSDNNLALIISLSVVIPVVVILIIILIVVLVFVLRKRNPSNSRVQTELPTIVDLSQPQLKQESHVS